MYANFLFSLRWLSALQWIGDIVHIVDELDVLVDFLIVKILDSCILLFGMQHMTVRTLLFSLGVVHQFGGAI